MTALALVHAQVWVLGLAPSMVSVQAELIEGQSLAEDSAPDGPDSVAAGVAVVADAPPVAAEGTDRSV